MVGSDLVTGMEYYHDQWAVIDDPFAPANNYLSKIDFFEKDNKNSLKMGDLDFVLPGALGYSDNCGVFS